MIDGPRSRVEAISGLKEGILIHDICGFFKHRAYSWSSVFELLKFSADGCNCLKNELT